MQMKIVGLNWLHRFRGARGPAVPSQRRRFRRVPCGIAIRVRSRRHGDLYSQVLDIAVGGVRLEVDGMLRVGEQVLLEYTGVLPGGGRPGDRAVRARVNWVQRHQHGCEVGLCWMDASTLLERSWVKMTLLDLGVAANRIADSRRSVRATADFSVRLTSGEENVTATVRDLSRDGALVETSSPLQPGTVVRLETATVTAKGRVVRQVGRGMVGIRFDHVDRQEAL
ncbi:MAG: PilZ domain-containing protein, partial [Candidatus Xenobia bacterium]